MNWKSFLLGGLAALTLAGAVAGGIYGSKELSDYLKSKPAAVETAAPTFSPLEQKVLQRKIVVPKDIKLSEMQLCTPEVEECQTPAGIKAGETLSLRSNYTLLGLKGREFQIEIKWNYDGQEQVLYTEKKVLSEKSGELHFNFQFPEISLETLLETSAARLQLRISEPRSETTAEQREEVQLRVKEDLAIAKIQLCHEIDNSQCVGEVDKFSRIPLYLLVSGISYLSASENVSGGYLIRDPQGNEISSGTLEQLSSANSNNLLFSAKIPHLENSKSPEGDYTFQIFLETVPSASRTEKEKTYQRDKSLIDWDNLCSRFSYHRCDENISIFPREKSIFFSFYLDQPRFPEIEKMIKRDDVLVTCTQNNQEIVLFQTDSLFICKYEEYRKYVFSVSNSFILKPLKHQKAECTLELFFQFEDQEEYLSRSFSVR